ncbi:RagB/SusD family nutrient uptake outer membrane protein [Sphingobacterium sp. UT-1RO-CII-1]|uniref:RagB/SusD family nutrient uptake outer membrane protein n=1 Tax=Sphingobacterium sp. UT-1RO-CII-1 TaxID=2995225 RepID=UPI00227B419B|nr:RagB/SusD family nutrient uptake outer membrane protein [Sphingobacterium sp. UT-1RO-CII-1]MCY4779151.1 RagB/SusD family nutrient uptake outer membrane protein [Sphingobacterium sp. UT-1RO-CII-1]
MSIINKYKPLKKYMESIKKCAVALFFMITVSGCNSYLDILPDNIANIDHIFANRKEAERYVATLYSYAPAVHHDSRRTLTFLGGDDVWTYDIGNNYDRSPGIRIARGEQNINSPYENFWDGDMFKAIRDCNVFIEEMSKTSRVPELEMSLRKRWLAEAKFLKAYYHFILFRMYGPIPIIDVNLDISSDVNEVLVSRAPVDEVVKYISGLLDESAADLPVVIQNTAEEAGRVTKAAAYMLKARLWVTAASPLFNGNPDYQGYADHSGQLLFSQQYEANQWQEAVNACEQALENISGAKLYYFTEAVDIHDPTRYQMNFRGALTDRFNTEIIWGRYMDSYQNIVLQAETSVPRMISGGRNPFQHSVFSVSMNMVERFYTENGVPIDEDITWRNTNRYERRYNTSSTGSDQRYNLIEGYSTALINQHRENRFYASLMFDGAVVFMKNTLSDEAPHKIRALFYDENGTTGQQGWSTVTGYWIRKLINWEYTHNQSGANTRTYSWPEMRLADLKLLYAESLNEMGRPAEAINQLDEIRKRSGLQGVVASWAQFSSNSGKPNTKDGLREIIHQEREIELAFEGHRLWDLKRWKKAADFLNKDVRGWNFIGKNAEEYYQVGKVFEQKFVAPRDYLWPISLSALLRNPKLVQNPGW